MADDVMLIGAFILILMLALAGLITLIYVVANDEKGRP